MALLGGLGSERKAPSDHRCVRRTALKPPEQKLNIFLHSSPGTRIESQPRDCNIQKEGQTGSADVQKTETEAQKQARAQARKNRERETILEVTKIATDGATPQGNRRDKQKITPYKTSPKKGKEEDPQITNHRR